MICAVALFQALRQPVHSDPTMLPSILSVLVSAMSVNVVTITLGQFNPACYACSWPHYWWLCLCMHIVSDRSASFGGWPVTERNALGFALPFVAFSPHLCFQACLVMSWPSPLQPHYWESPLGPRHRHDPGMLLQLATRGTTL